MEEMMKSELDFYSKFARPLIINLPDSKDRVLAAGWVKKIMDNDVGSSKLRTDYLKLLLFALQRQKLVGIFADDPNKYEKLEDFPEEFDLNEMAKKLIETEHSDRQDRIRRQLRGQVGDFPPYTTDFSADFREYVAAQDIPGFGVHCYYAISKDPITSWRKVDKNILPKFAKSAVDTASPVPPGVISTSSDPSCICPTLGPEVTDKAEQCKASRGKASPEPVKKKKRKFGRQPPTHLLGKVAEPEEREAPNWGTNLVEVKVIPKQATGAVPRTKSEGKVPADDDSVMEDLEECVKEYRRGEMGKTPRRKRKGLEDQRGDEEETEDREPPGYEGTPFQSIAGALVPREEYITSEKEESDAFRRQQEIAEDEDVIEHFRRQLKKADARKKVSAVTELIEKSSPAKSQMPVTTPRVSTSPKRPKDSEKLFEDIEGLPDVGELPDIPGADRDMLQLYMQVSAAADQEKLDVSITKKSEKSATEEHRISRVEQEKSKEEALDDEEIEELGPPIQLGSPDANIIIADFMAAKRAKDRQPDMFDADLEYLPLSPPKPGLESPPIFSRDARIQEEAFRMEYPDSGTGEVDWTHAPDYFQEGQQDPGASDIYERIAERRQLSPSELRRIPKPKELTEKQMEMMRDPRYRDQMFFEAQMIPEEVDDLYDIDIAQQEMQEAQLRSPVDEFGLPLRVDIRQLPVRQDAPVVMPRYQPPAQIQLPPLQQMESPRTPPHVLDTSVPKGLPEPLQPPDKVLGYVTPEHLKMKKPEKQPFIPVFDMDIELPCDEECSPMALHDTPSEFAELGLTPPDLLPPSPMSPLPSPPALSPSPRVPLSLSPRVPQGPPVRRKMTPQRLDFSERSEFPASPSLLIAEPGSPQMLEEMSPKRVYGVEPLEEPLSPGIMDLEGFQLDGFLDETQGGGPCTCSGAASPDLGQYLMFDQPGDDLDMGRLEDLGDVTLETTPPEMAHIPDSDIQAMMDKWKRQAEMIFPFSLEPKPFVRPKSPEPKKKEDEKVKLSDTEKQYIGYLFEHDPKTAEFVMKMASVVADIEQDFPDPLHWQYPVQPEEAEGILDQAITGQDILQASPQLSPEKSPPKPAEPSPPVPSPRALPLPIAAGPPDVPPQMEPTPGPSGVPPQGRGGRGGRGGIPTRGKIRPPGIPLPGRGRASGIPAQGLPRYSSTPAAGRPGPSGIGRGSKRGGRGQAITRPPAVGPSRPLSPVPSPPQAPCAPCPPKMRTPPREPPIITITEATPEWLAAERDAAFAREAAEFAEQFGGDGGTSMFVESPPQSFNEVLFRSPSPEPEWPASSPPFIEFTGAGLEQGDDLFGEQFPQDQHYDDLFGASPPEDFGIHRSPCQPCQSRQPSPHMEPHVSPTRQVSPDRQVSPARHDIRQESAEPQPRTFNPFANEFAMDRYKRMMRANALGLGPAMPLPPSFAALPKPVRREIDTEYVQDIPEERTTSPPRAPHVFDSPVPEGLPQPMSIGQQIPGWITPPHLKDLRVKTGAQSEPAETRIKPQLGGQFYQQIGTADTLPYGIQRQLQHSGADQYLGQGFDDIDLVDDSELSPYTSPGRPCGPCRRPTPSPPLPPSPPQRTPSPRAGDIFREEGVAFSPRSSLFTRHGRDRLDPSMFTSHDPDWMNESPLRQSTSPERERRQSSTQRRYVVSRSPSEQPRRS